MQIALLLLVIFIVLLTLKVPIAASMGIASICGFLLIGFNIDTVGGIAYSAVSGSSMLCIPGYIFAGAIMARGGIADNLVNCLRCWLGHFPGGMALIAILGCAFFAAITGSSSATIAAIGALMIPAMISANYEERFSMGLIASAGSLGILIPPSIPMVLYATIAEQSVSKLFAAGMIPGVLVCVVYFLYSVVYTTRRKQGSIPRVPIRERWLITLKAIPALFLPVSILGGIYAGIMTPNEAAAFACVYALLISFFVYRSMNLKDLYDSLVEATKSTASIMLIVVACTMFSQFLTTERIPHQILEFVQSTNMSATMLVIICALVIIVLGCFMDGVSIMLIAAPLMAPVVADMGFDMIQFGIVMTIGIQVGQLTPPVGLNLFIVSSMMNKPVVDVIRGSWRPLILLLICWFLVIIYPPLSTWLPTMLSG